MPQTELTLNNLKPSTPRADRSRVMWGGRVRKFDDATWHGAVILNMSMSGALLELTCRAEVGEWPSTVVAVGFAPAKVQAEA